jgi:carbamoyl-phosphate synthase large subunit
MAKRQCRPLPVRKAANSVTDILILSAGRRVSLVRLFRQAAAQHGLSVATADMRPSMSSACQDNEARVELPHVNAPDYVERLEKYCVNAGVRLVVPTIDTELPILAGLKAHFATFGCTIAVSDLPLVEHCADKRLTGALFESMGLSMPRRMEIDALSFPLIIKPYDGSLSAGISVLRDPSELTPLHLDNPRNMFCQYLEHADHDEFTCDAYFDRHNLIRAVVPRLRIEVRGGEVSKGQTVHNEIVPFLTQHLAHLPGAIGCLTIQIMRHRATGAMYLIEVNARFGGGYPLTAQAGACYHQWLIEEYILSRPIDNFSAWHDRLFMLRYDAEIFVDG